MVKISKLKAKPIRAIIPVFIDGKKEEITVYNIKPSQREEIKNFIQQKMDKGTDTENLVITARETVSYLYKELTDLEIDTEEDILEIISNPIAELVLVSAHINDIIYELNVDILVSKKQELNMVHQQSLEANILRSIDTTLEKVNVEKEYYEEYLRKNEIVDTNEEEVEEKVSEDGTV